MFLVAAAALVLAVVAFASRGSSNARPPAPAPRPQQPSAPVVPPPAPQGPSVVVVPDQPAIWAVDDTTHDGGVISPPADMGPEAVSAIDTHDLPPELLAIVQEASTASDADLEHGAATADELGYPDVADHLRRRVSRRQAYARAQREGTAPPSPRDVPIPAQSSQPAALPTARADRAELQRLATRVADNIRRSGPRMYDRALLLRFQVAAGLRADGKYGRQTASALGTYGHLPGGQVPPAQY